MKGGKTSPKEVLRVCEEKDVKIIDVKFTDLPGQWQHLSAPLGELDEATFTDGIGFDGSSIRGWQAIDESDMVVLPDSKTAFLDPFTATPTLSIVGDILDPITRENYTRDPRFVGRKAESYLVQTGIADRVYFGPEAEFFIFDEVRFDQTQHSGYYYIDSVEGVWNSGNDGNGSDERNLGYKPRYKEGYFPVPPTDSQQDIRTEMLLTLIECGIRAEMHHHEVATAGQAEIDMRFAPLTQMGDQLMLYKYVIKNVARKHGKTVTFMPKPLFGDNGSGMHVHISLWKDGENIFYDPKGYAHISQTCLYFIGGILKHAPALLAFCAPTTNSYKRLVPGYEAPVNLAYSQRNRSACIRIPVYLSSEKATRVEFRCPDATCNPYLAFAAILMAGIDGIENRLDPGNPLDFDLYELEPEEAAKVKQVPGSLDKVLEALEADHGFLTKGDVFTVDVLETWIRYKREHEIDPVRLRPHPYEFFLYYDA
jgi:glutamine synthetase